MKGIIFSTEMVKAILDGSKTQTRRVIKPQPPMNCRMISAVGIWAWELDGEFIGESRCPYGGVGDGLWVKETWAEQSGDIYYKADWGDSKPVNMVFDNIKWCSPRFMPRWASRIDLEITDLRAERLQDISEEDAKAEGAPSFWLMNNKGEQFDSVIPSFWFENLWDSINPKHRWDRNEWVLVVSFKRVN